MRGGGGKARSKAAAAGAAGRYAPLVLTTARAKPATVPPARPDAAAGAQQPKITEMFTKGTPKTALKADKPLLPTKEASYSPEECKTQSWDHGSQDEVEIAATPTALRCGAAIVTSSPATASPSPCLCAEVRSARKSKLSLKRKTSPAGNGDLHGEEERRAEDRRREQLREEARRRHLREEEDRRVQERWEREDLLTLASSRVPPPQEMVVEAEDEETGTQQTSTRVGKERPRAPGRREAEAGTSRRATECIELLDSSQEEEVEAVGTGCELTGHDRRGNAGFGQAAHGVGHGWEVEMDENGVLLEDEPDDEELGEYARPKSPGMRSKALNYEAGSACADGASGGSSRQAQDASACSSDFGRRQHLARRQEHGFGEFDFDEDANEVEGMEQLTSRRGLFSNSNGSGARVAHAISWEGVDGNEREEGKRTQEDAEENDDGWGSDESEAFMQRLMQQGGLVSEASTASRASDSAGDRPRDPKRRRSPSPAFRNSRDSECDEDEHAHSLPKGAGGKRGRGRSGRGTTSGRVGYWMTERYGPHKSQYKRVYVDGSGHKHTGRAAFAAAKLDGKQPGANKKKSAKKSGAEEAGAMRARGKAGGKSAGPNPSSSRKGGAGGSKKLAQMPGTQVQQHTMRVGSQPDAGKGKVPFSARAASLVGMANASASQSGNAGPGRREAPKGIRAMFKNIVKP